MNLGITLGVGARSVVGSLSGGPIALNDLTDVTITTPSNGHELVFDGSEWVNQ